MKHLASHAPEYLRLLPTLFQGQFAELKLERGELRYWVSRMTKRDGETNAVYVEHFDRQRSKWVTVYQYGEPCD